MTMLNQKQKNAYAKTKQHSGKRKACNPGNKVTKQNKYATKQGTYNPVSLQLPSDHVRSF